MSNLELIQEGYKNFAEGNVEAVLANFHPQIEWHESTGFPYVKGDGISRGPEAIVQDVFVRIPEYFEGFNIDANDLFESGDKVVMVGYYTGTWKPTGKEFKAHAAHIWTVKDGKVTKMFQVADTATIIN